MKAKGLTIIEIVNKSTDFLSSKEIDSAKSEVEWILSSVLGTSRVQLYLDHENLVSEDKVNYIRDMRGGKEYRCNIFLEILTSSECQLGVTVVHLLEDGNGANG